MTRAGTLYKTRKEMRIMSPRVLKIGIKSRVTTFSKTPPNRPY